MRDIKNPIVAAIVPEPAQYSQREKEIIQDKMDQINFFFKKHNRKPDGASKEIIERILFYRLTELRKRPNAIEFLNDPHNLLFP